MALLKITCPECNAGLKSAKGFAVGQTVSCPKCETYFTVEEPEEDEDDAPLPPKKKAMKAAVADDDEEDEKPKKKKKKKARDDDAERSYKNSPLRYAVLGILVVIMLVLAYFLYDKKKKEKESADATPAPADTDPEPAPRPVGRPNNNFRPQQVGPIVGNPSKAPNVPPKKGPDVGGIAAGAVDGLLSGSGPQNAAEGQKLRQKYTAALVGAWAADLGDGVTEQLTYAADGTFTASRAGAAPTTASGRYAVKALVGTKGLKLELTTSDRTRTVTVTFEDNELQHPSIQPGVTATFRKK